MSTYRRDLDPSERPLAFDGRQRDYAPPRRSPAPVTLILSLLVLAGVGGGVFYLYRGGVRAPTGAPAPVGTPVGDVRIAAPPQAPATDPAAGLSIYKDNPNAASAPTFAPAPEQPTPRPDAAAASPADGPIAAAPAKAAAIPSNLPPGTEVLEAPAPATAKPAKVASIDTILAGTTAAAKPTSVTKSAAAEKSTSATKAAAPEKTTSAAKAAAGDKSTAATKTATTERSSAAAKPAVLAKTATTPEAKSTAKTDSKPDTKVAGGFVVQIGAFSSQALADKSWNSAAGVAPGAMAGKGKHVAQTSKNGETLYRVAITGFATKDQAQAMCAKLVAAGRTCFVR